MPRSLTIHEWAVLIATLREHGVRVDGRVLARLVYEGVIQTSGSSATLTNGDNRDAGVAELAYAADSKPAPERGEGSSPSSSTNKVM